MAARPTRSGGPRCSPSPSPGGTMRFGHCSPLRVPPSRVSVPGKPGVGLEQRRHVGRRLKRQPGRVPGPSHPLVVEHRSQGPRDLDEVVLSSKDGADVLVGGRGLVAQIFGVTMSYQTPRIWLADVLELHMPPCRRPAHETPRAMGARTQRADLATSFDVVTGVPSTREARRSWGLSQGAECLRDRALRAARRHGPAGGRSRVRASPRRRTTLRRRPLLARRPGRDSIAGTANGRSAG